MIVNHIGNLTDRGGSSGGSEGARASHTAGNSMEPLLNPFYKFEKEKWGMERIEEEEKGGEPLLGSILPPPMHTVSH